MVPSEVGALLERVSDEDEVILSDPVVEQPVEAVRLAEGVAHLVALPVRPVHLAPSAVYPVLPERHIAARRQCENFFVVEESA